MACMSARPWIMESRTYGPATCSICGCEFEMVSRNQVGAEFPTCGREGCRIKANCKRDLRNIERRRVRAIKTANPPRQF
jgi:hypothetical protein